MWWWWWWWFSGCGDTVYDFVVQGDNVYEADNADNKSCHNDNDDYNYNHAEGDDFEKNQRWWRCDNDSSKSDGKSGAYASLENVNDDNNEEGTHEELSGWLCFFSSKWIIISCHNLQQSCVQIWLITHNEDQESAIMEW